MSRKPDFRGSRTMRLLRALVETQDWLRDQIEPDIRSYGLEPREFDCLVNLGVDQPLRMCDLAQRTLTAKSHTTQVVKKLEARGLVRRRRSSENEREVWVSLTPEGQALFACIYPAHYEFLKRLFGSHLDEAEQDQLSALVRKLRAGR